MVLLGLLLMLGCTALAVDVAVQNADAISGLAFNQSISGLTLGGVFVAGAVLGVLFALGLAMFVGGLGRAARIRRERRVLRDSAAERDNLLAQHAEMERELTARRDAGAYPADPATSTDAEQGAEQGALRGRHRA